MSDSISRRLIAAAVLLLAGTSAALAPSLAAAQAQAPYAVSVFSRAPGTATQPDSIVAWRDRIIVGFENGVAKDGSEAEPGRS